LGIFYRKREEESSFADEVLSSKPMGQVINCGVKPTGLPVGAVSITYAMLDDCWRGYDISYKGIMRTLFCLPGKIFVCAVK
jgi:hypothetical protein